MSLKTNIRSFLAVSAFALMGAATGAESPPEVEIKATTDEVLAVMARKADARALSELAESKVVPHFDFRRMTQLAAGRVWQQASATQQETLTQEFQHLLVRTYTRALASTQHDKANVAIQPSRTEQGSNETTVRTTVTEPGRKPIAINYRMERNGSGWKVVDVVVENISLVTNYRDWFASQAQAGGVDGVIKALAEKNRAAAEKMG